MKKMTTLPAGWTIDEEPLYGAPDNQQQPQAVTSEPGVTDDGSILDTIGKRWNAQKEAVLAAGTSDPTLREWQMDKTRDALKSWESENQKLGTMRQLAAGIGGSAPAIAAGMANPLLGGAVAAGMTTSDALLAQMENNREMDLRSAGMAGLASGAVDALTGGLASKAKAALPIAKPLAGRIGVNMAEDVTSNVAAQTFENMAAGKDWSDSLGEAAAFGAAGGTVVRGSLAGLNKALNIPLNKGGEDTISTLNSLRHEDGLGTTKEFADELYEYNNSRDALFTQLQEATDEGGREAASALVNQAVQSGGRTGFLKAVKAFKDQGVPITSAAFDIDIATGLRNDAPSFHAGREMNISDKEMRTAGEAAENARPTFFTQTSAKKKGETKESFYEELQRGADKTLAVGRGSFDNNIKIVDDNIDMLLRSADGGNTEIRSDMKTLRREISDLQDYMNKTTSNKRTDLTDSIEISARNVYDLASKYGFLDKLQGLNGKPGSFDPVTDIMAIRTMDDMLKRMYPSLDHGAPNLNKQYKGKDSTPGWAKDMITLAAGGPGAFIARKALGSVSDSIGGRMSQRRLRKAKNRAAERADQLTSALAASPAQRPFRMKTAAKSAAESLADEGITPVTPKEPTAASESVSTPEPTVSTPADVAPATERPVSSPEPTVTKAKPGSMVKKKQPKPETAPEPSKPAPGSTSKGMTQPMAKKEAPVVQAEVETPAPKAEAEAPKKEAPTVTKQTGKMTSAPKTKKQRRKERQAERKRQGQESRGMQQQPTRTPKSDTEADMVAHREQSVKEANDAVQSFDDDLSRINSEIEALKAKKEVWEAGAADRAAADRAKAESGTETPVVTEAPTEPSKGTKSESKPLPTSAPKASEEPVQAAPEPTPAPKAAPGSESQGMTKSPKTKEAPAEEVKTETEAPKEDAPEVETPKEQAPKAKTVNARELVDAPLKKIVAETTRPRAERTPEMMARRRIAERMLEEHNKLSNSLSASWNVSPDYVSNMISDIGGMEALTKLSKDRGISQMEILRGMKRESDALASEMAADKRAALRTDLKNKNEQDMADAENNSASQLDPDYENNKIRDRHDEVRSILRSEGIEEDIIDRAFDEAGVKDAEDIKPRVIMNYARRFAKDAAPAPALPKKAEPKKAPAKAPKPTADDSRKILNEFVEGLEMNGDSRITKIVDNALRGRHDALKDGQMNSVMNRIVNVVEQDIAAYENATRGLDAKGKPLPAMSETDKARALEILATLKGSRAQVDAVRKTADAEMKRQADIQRQADELDAQLRAEEAQTNETFAAETKEHARLQRKYEDLWMKMEEKMENQAAMLDQRAEVEAEMASAGVTPSVASKLLNIAYDGKSAPLSLGRIDALQTKALRETEKAKKAVKQQATKTVEQQTKDMTPEQLVTYANESVDMLLDMPPAAFVGAMEGILKGFAKNMEGMKKPKGRDKEIKKVEYLKAFADIVDMAGERSAKYPRNPELWISADQKQNLQRLMGGQGSTYLGNFQKVLATKFFGDADERRYMNLSEKVIGDKITRLEKDRARKRKKKEDAAILGEFADDMKIK